MGRYKMDIHNNLMVKERTPFYHWGLELTPNLSIESPECIPLSHHITTHTHTHVHTIKPHPLATPNSPHSLAHDHDGLVASAHLHPLHQVSHLQHPCGALGHPILWPIHVLELSHGEAGIADSHLCFALCELQLPDNVVTVHLLFGEGDCVFAISLTGTSTRGPVLMTHLLCKISTVCSTALHCRLIPLFFS